jgi:hypothetical protein
MHPEGGSVTQVELDKIAMRLVAVDRQAAATTVAAIRQWAASRKATPRVQHAILWAQAIADTLDKTSVTKR